MDIFTVPTLTFQALYRLFLINHDRRRILHFSVTPHPTSQWIAQQFREGFSRMGPRPSLRCRFSSSSCRNRRASLT
jgi:hypothetical protein